MYIPPNAAERLELHDEIHARPTARIRLPALVIQVVVLNEGVTASSEFDHLRKLPSQEALKIEHSARNFMRLRLPGGTLKWERHAEVTRYSLVQALPTHNLDSVPNSFFSESLIVEQEWFRLIPGNTLAAIELVMIEGSAQEISSPLPLIQRWFGQGSVFASYIGRNSNGCAISDFHVRDSGFERILVIALKETSETRAGRIAARLFDLETYRMLALRGLPVARKLQPLLLESENFVSDVTSAMETQKNSDADLLHRLAAAAARVERATAEHSYRFNASAAYYDLVRARIDELREKAIPGTQTVGEFLLRRLAPAMATVQVSSSRLNSLSMRIERAGALLRTRVDIAHETQNQSLLERLARGQELQLKLQRTVEGLSIAAISYYIISLLLYVSKGFVSINFPFKSEAIIASLIPVVLIVVWWFTRRSRSD